MNLEGFVNLKELRCGENRLTDLNLNDCVNLEVLKCYGNQLTSLDFLDGGKPTELITLDGFFENDLVPRNKFANLKVLNLASNKITGSLKPLQNLNKLEELNINNTDIDSGLEYLPDSLRHF